MDMYLEIIYEFDDLSIIETGTLDAIEGGCFCLITITDPDGDIGSMQFLTDYKEGTGYSYELVNLSKNITVVEDPAATFTITIADYAIDYELIFNTTTGVPTIKTAAGIATDTTIVKVCRIG